MLGQEEERELIKKAQAGDIAARDKLINSNLRLVIAIASRYRSPGMERADLIQEGALGLIKAIERYDFSHDTRFSTYSGYWVRQRISQYIVENSNTIRLPLHFQEAATKIQKARRYYHSTHATEPSVEKLAQLTGISTRKIDTVAKNSITIESIHSQKLNHEGGAFAPREIPDDAEQLLEEKIELEQLGRLALEKFQNYIQDCVERGDVRALRNITIFIERVFNERILKDIGQQYNISRERIRQIQNIQAEKLRDILLSEGIDLRQN